ncbi:type A2 lantipeptide [Streptantibioticus ferralitis]|uniref:Type A2 lantipeptide n=1 Tax=Streptantibioticus ferralitis TaxID=236510 RepID=A0ABT5YWB6_9ACTN|nr:type A2 lantipeptide [Streptantibioticus ferralitis]MDF2255646.1 type A2 lantipeptide [Streptantibioticus ferralitis]
MRKDFTPQVETREIDDTELDNVSGGVGALGLNVSGVVGSVVGTVDSVVPGVGPTVGQVTGLVPGVTGLAGL